MNLHEFDISRRYPATLVSSERITPEDGEAEVRHLVLKLPEGAINYLEGQSIGVLPPGPREFGNPYHLRLYSIASPREGENHPAAPSPSACAAASTSTTSAASAIPAKPRTSLRRAPRRYRSDHRPLRQPFPRP